MWLWRGEGERRATAVDEVAGRVAVHVAARMTLGDVAAAATVGGWMGGSGAAAADEATGRPR